MDISLNNIGKRFRLDWIFRNVNLEIPNGSRLAILGPNGSGKSTLMKVVCGHLTPSKGAISFSKNNNTIPIDQVYREVSYAAPYIELIEDFSLKEAIEFQRKFKPYYNNISTKAIIDRIGLKRINDKLIREFSSGMKQRVKIALALYAQTSVVLLDEPSTNLDRQGIAWYLEQVKDYQLDRTIIVASNVEEDFSFCNQQINILDFKKKSN